MPSELDFPHSVPTLSTRALHLRGLSETDIPGWFARASDLESATFAGDAVPTSITEGHAWLERHHARFREQTALRWAIVPIGAPASIGTIGLAFPAPGAATAELGFVLARAYWNQGLGTAAARLVTRYAFETLGLADIRAETLRRNHASRRLLEKLGFRHHHAYPATPPAEPEPYDTYILANPA